jgi:hypothetical protein
MNSRLTTVLAIIGSLLIHAAFLFVLVSAAGLKPPPPPPPKNDIRIELVETKPAIPPPPDKTRLDKHGKKVYERDEVICSNKDNTYVGVGLMIQPGSDTVVSAPKQYPAYLAGIRVGDFIIDPFFTNIVDGYLDFRVIRGYDVIQFHIRVENICYKTAD